jgi:hypothetical protein
MMCADQVLLSGLSGVMVKVLAFNNGWRRHPTSCRYVQLLADDATCPRSVRSRVRGGAWGHADTPAASAYR